MTHLKLTARVGTIALATVAALINAAPAAAQEQKTLKITNVFPAANFHWSESLKPFSEGVTKATGGKIQFEPYFAGQLAKDGVGPLASGLADIAVLAPAYEPGKLPLTSVVELPGLYSSSCEATAKWWNIAKDGGPLNNAEYKPQGIKVLYGVVFPPYVLMTKSKKVASLNELSGQKIRANGAAMDKTLRALGGVPVRVTVNELYDALSRGTIDGALWTIGFTRVSGLEKAFGQLTQGPQLGGASVVYGMRQKTWDALTADQQAAVTKVAAETQQRFCGFLDKLDADETAVLMRDHKLVATKLSDDERARWTERLAPIASDWAKEMDSTGRPGTALLKAFREAAAR